MNIDFVFSDQMCLDTAERKHIGQEYCCNMRECGNVAFIAKLNAPQRALSS